MSDINIMAIDPKTRRVSFSFNLVPVKAEGVPALLQLCIKTVLTTTGKDKFSPLYGGNVRDYARKGVFRNDLSAVKADIVHMISDAAAQIKQEQLNSDLPETEILKSMVVTSIQWNDVLDTLDVYIKVTSLAGDSVEVNLGNQLR
jgi:hypothetical protein